MSSEQSSPSSEAPSHDVGELPSSAGQKPEAIGKPTSATPPRGWGRALAVAAVLGALALTAYFGLQSLLREPQLQRPLSSYRLPPEPVDAARSQPAQAESSPAQLPLSPLAPESSAELIAEAERVATDLTQRFPANPDSHEMLARYQFEFGELNAATSAWQRCLQLDPNYAYAHAGLGKVASELGDHTQAVAHWRRAVVADSGMVTHQLELGKALLTSGDVDDAMEVLERAVLATPSSPQIHAELGTARLQKRDNEGAKAAFEKALALDDGLPGAHFGLATACVRLGEVDKARRHEARHAELRGERTEEVRRSRRDYDDNRALAEDMAKLYTDMGSVCLAAGQSELAEQLWRRAARLHAGNRASRQSLAWLFRQNKKPLESILQLRELARLEPENAIYPVEMARVFVDLERVEDGLRVLTEFVETVPDNSAGQTSLAEFLLDVKKEPGQAAVHAQRAAELTGAASNWSLLSTAHDRQGDLPAAVAAIERASELDPENQQYRQRLTLLKERAKSSAVQQEPDTGAPN